LIPHRIYEATFLAHCKQPRLKATLWRAAVGAMPFRRVQLIATRLAYHETESNKTQTRLIGAIRCAQDFLPLKTYAHGATLLLSSTKLLAMSKKSCLVCCGLTAKM
jgi:hypothetical protein